MTAATVRVSPRSVISILARTQRGAKTNTTRCVPGLTMHPRYVPYTRVVGRLAIPLCGAGDDRNDEDPVARVSLTESPLLSASRPDVQHMIRPGSVAAPLRSRKSGLRSSDRFLLWPLFF